MNNLIINLTICFPSMILYDHKLLTKECTTEEIFQCQELRLQEIDFGTYKKIISLFIQLLQKNNYKKCFFYKDINNIQIDLNDSITLIDHHSHQLPQYDSLLLNNNNIDLWIRNGNSYIPQFTTIHKNQNVFEYNWNNLLNNNFDNIYIIFSNHLYSQIYCQLYDVLANIYFLLTKQQPYFEDDLERNINYI